MPVAAQTSHEGQVPKDRILVLKIDSRYPGSAVVVKVKKIWLDVVVFLMLPNILAEFGAQCDSMSFEKDSGSIALKVPPASVRCVVVFRVGRDALAGIVVYVDSVIAIPIIGGSNERLPGSERVVVLDIDVTAGVGSSGTRIIENGTEGGGRNVLGTRCVDNMNVKIPVDDVGKQTIGLVSIGVF